ncbi:MAG TPA: hypothetical protein VN963_01295 [bacterium]|nr:hypothetical protein [bacterium]
MKLLIGIFILIFTSLMASLSCTKTYTLSPGSAFTSTPTITSTPTATPTPIVVSWTLATSSAAPGGREGQSSVTFNNQMWMIAGYTGTFMDDVWSSSDGVNWNQITAAASFSGRNRHGSAVFNGDMWVVGGVNGTTYYNDVWYSANGSTWTSATAAAPFSGRSQFGLVVFNNQMWLIGGYSYNSGTGTGYDYGDVWKTSDGVNWTQVTALAPFSYRHGLTALVFNNQMWVISGKAPAGDVNDVWSTPDGVNWTEVTANAAFSGRDGHTSVVFDNAMWVIGGEYYNSGTWVYDQDVWYSRDGANWVQSTASAPFGLLAFHSSVVYNSEMWVIDGQNGTYSLNDIWHAP